MITIELKEDRATAALARLDDALDDLTPVMQEIGEALTISAKDRMLRGEEPDGGAFAPRRPSTIRAYERRKIKPQGGPLNLTGDLRQGIFPQAGPAYVEVGSNMIYAAVMQFGASQGEFGAHIGRDKLGRDHFHTIPWGPIPARPFLGLSGDDQDAIEEIVGEAIGRALVGG